MRPNLHHRNPAAAMPFDGAATAGRAPGVRPPGNGRTGGKVERFPCHFATVRLRRRILAGRRPPRDDWKVRATPVSAKASSATIGEREKWAHG
jgi:hypothetical protein